MGIKSLMMSVTAGGVFILSHPLIILPSKALPKIASTLTFSVRRAIKLKIPLVEGFKGRFSKDLRLLLQS
jgi:hypothetical protein